MSESMNDKFTINDPEWAEKFQKEAEEYMDNLYDQLWEGVEGDVEAEIKTHSGDPFCGCNACHWREVLVFVVPRVLLASQEGKISLVD